MKVPAGRAVLHLTGAQAEASANVLRICEATTSGIEEVKSAPKTKSVIYDLNGRKVAQPEQGLYNINGKNVFVK